MKFLLLMFFFIKLIFISFLWIFLYNFFFFKIILMFNFSSMSFLKLNIFFLLDFISMIFSLVVIFISMIILIYNYFYMMEHHKFFFYYMFFYMFIYSMVLLIYSPHMFNILISWDFLGITSFFLIIFYLNNLTFKNGFLVMFFNRLSDSLMMMNLLICSMSLFLTFSFYKNFLNKNILFFFFMMLSTSLIKSAQFPFSIWLPIAMSAPTPVSALVHSSTLVTAGIYFLIRFWTYISSIIYLKLMILLLFIITFLFFGFMAMFEMDLKKIIAMSTLSQLGFIMIILYMNEKIFSFFYLINHALFKSLLFLMTGMLLIYSFGNQNIRLIFYLKPLSFFFFNFLTLSLLSMSGVPFFSGFFLKDFILEILFNNFNSFMIFLLIIGCIFTIMYSIKIYLIFFKKNIYSLSLKIFLKKKDLLILFFLYILLLNFYKLFFLKFTFFFNKLICFWFFKLIFFFFLIFLYYIYKKYSLLMNYFVKEMYFLNWFSMSYLMIFYNKIKILKMEFIYQNFLFNPFFIENMLINNKILMKKNFFLSMLFILMFFL